MKKALVLGSEGLLGTAIVPEFKKVYDVAAWDRADIDVTDREQVAKKIGDLRPDIILNLVAYNGVDLAETDENAKALARKLNVETVKYLVEVSESIGSTLVHFSTDYVFSGNSGKGYNESATPDPVSHYGMTKYEGEQIIQKVASKYYIIRLSRLFGPVGSSSVSKKSFIDSIIEKASEGKPMKMVSDEYSCATYSPDISRLVLGVVQDSLPYGIYHGANSGVSNWYDLARLAFEIKGIKTEIVPVSSEEFKRPAKRPEYSELLNTKLPLQRSWQEALTDHLKQ